MRTTFDALIKQTSDVNGFRRHFKFSNSEINVECTGKRWLIFACMNTEAYQHGNTNFGMYAGYNV
jgi:hypothetical protein